MSEENPIGKCLMTYDGYVIRFNKFIEPYHLKKGQYEFVLYKDYEVLQKQLAEKDAEIKRLNTTRIFVQENAELKEKLAVAVEALGWYWADSRVDVNKRAREALDKIKEKEP